MGINLYSIGIFNNDFLEEVTSDTQQRYPNDTVDEAWSYTLEDVKYTLHNVLNRVNPSKTIRNGRIGPAETVFDSEHKMRGVTFQPDLLTATCSKFKSSATAQANTAVFKGRWMYEVQLTTSGVMQVGWSTIHCRFMGHAGVGDTENSYSYDGQRMKKWNLTAQDYGESWLSGDVIGAAIDVNEGTIEFYRNGHSMGVAFEKIKIGQGMAYIPTVSMSNGGTITANFGGSLFKHPIPGYEPIQAAPLKSKMKADMLLEWIENLLKLQSENPEFEMGTDDKVSNKAIIYLFASLLFRNLCPLLNKTYVIEASLLPFFKRLVLQKEEHFDMKSEYKDLHKFLDYAWVFLETEEIYQVLRVISDSLESTYRRTTPDINYFLQKETLCILYALSLHDATRRHLVSIRGLFLNGRIYNFMHVKPMDDKDMKSLIQDVCWEHEISTESHNDLGEEERREKYLNSIATMYNSVTELEQMRLCLLRTLVTNTDGTDSRSSSRKMFLKELHDFLHEHNFLLSRHKPPKIAGPTLCSNFYALLSLLQSLWSEEILDIPASVRIEKCIEDAWRVMNQPHLGGSYKSLNVAWLGEESEDALDRSEEIQTDNIRIDEIATIDIVTPENEQTEAPVLQQVAGTTDLTAQVLQEAPIAEEPVAQLPEPVVAQQRSLDAVNTPSASTSQIRSQPGISSLRSTAIIQHNREFFAPDRVRFQTCNQYQPCFLPIGDLLISPGNADSRESLEELLNNIILLYKSGVHQQLVHVASIKSKMRDHVKGYNEYKKFHKSDGTLSELDKYYEVYRDGIDMQSRHVAWILSAIYSPQKQQQLAWLLQVLLRTLKEASRKGYRFKLIPCSYVESTLLLTFVMRTSFEPLSNISKLPDSFELLKDVAAFVSNHLPDERIVDKNIKELIQETAADFFSSPLTLKCMESVPGESKRRFIRVLLKAYQGHNWAQTNLILVRIWHGSGFAFRYTRFPHLAKFGSATSLLESDVSFHLRCVRNKPYPSSVYHAELQSILLDETNTEETSLFLNSLLNQLNWAFSELIGILQIMQNQTSSLISIQMRHMTVTATCFEILVSLLRVLEMVLVLARPLFTDPARPNAGNMLERLVQFLIQLLIRTTSNEGCFNFVLNLDIRSPEFLLLAHFPVLAAVAGVLVALLQDEITDNPEDTIPPITRILLSEKFPIWSVQFMLNEDNEHNSKINFSFEDYKEDVLNEEIESIRKMICCLKFYKNRLSTTSEMSNDENKCTICYNYNISAKFEPCGHESCKSCINHHLLNNRLCFFCKTQITKVYDHETRAVLHEFTNA